MYIYLIRHAAALSIEEAEVRTDADRPLSEEGIRQIDALAKSLPRLGVKLDAVICSPLLRTRQTAERLLQTGNSSVFLENEESIAPGGSRKRLAKRLRDFAGQSVAVIGHEPDLGEFAAWLIGSRKAQIEFAKGSMACIHCDDRVAKGNGVLEWLAIPEWFFAD